MAETAIVINGFTLINPDKVNRALDGAMNERGQFLGGVRRQDGTYDKAELLAEYDRIGGLIKKGDDKVRMGSFYDFKTRRPRTEPNVEFEFRVNGEVIIVPAEEEKPNKVKAVQLAEKVEREKRVKKEKKEEVE